MVKKETTLTSKDKFRADIEGECLGVNFKFVNEGEAKERVLLNLCIEDDERYNEVITNLDSYWIDDLIETLQKTKKYMDDNFEKGKWSYHKK